MAASNLQIYSIFNVTVNGTLAAEHASASFDQNTNSQMVKTVHKGYAGESPGAPMTECTIDMVIPAVGFEPAQLNMMLAMDQLVPVQFTFYIGAFELTFNGFVVHRSGSHAVDGEAKISFKARGSYAAFQALAV